MVRKSDKRKQRIIISIIGIIIVAVITIVLIRTLTPNKIDPYVMRDDVEVSSTTDQQPVDTPPPATEAPADGTDAKQTPDTDTTEESSLDPGTVATIDIEPMDLTVSYVKGVGGFSFEVKRTPGGSQYVEFSSESLAGTKCTNDTGVFATILEDPTSGDDSTIAKTVSVGDTKYGLSLAAPNCTADSAKLQAYQQSFSDAFSLLKKME